MTASLSTRLLPDPFVGGTGRALAAVATSLLLGLLLMGCPPRPILRPRAPGFNRWDAKARLDRTLAALEKGPARRRAVARRDLAWLLLIHFGDARRAEALLGLASREAGSAPAPWVAAGLAIIADLRLDVEGAARAWHRTLVHLLAAEANPGRRLTPPRGLSQVSLATMAAHRLARQLPHIPGLFSDGELARLRSKLSGSARETLSLALVGRARLGGEPTLLRRRLVEAGCPLRYTISRRYGRLGRLDLATRFPPEGSRRLSGRKVTPLSCGVRVQSHTGSPGVRYLEAVVSAPAPGPAVVRVVWDRPFTLSLNGVHVFGPEGRQLPRPRHREIQVTLRRGSNRLLLKVPVLATPAWLRLQVVPGASPTGSGGTKPRAVETPAPRYRALADTLAVARALHMGLPDAGRASAARLVKLTPRYTWGVYMASRIERSDPLVGYRVGRARSRLLLRRALARARWATRIRLDLASMLRRRGRASKGLELLGEIPAEAALPQGARRLVTLARIRLHRSKGWTDLALTLARRLARANRSWLPAWKLYYLLALWAQSAASTVEAAQNVRRLDATSIAWAQTLARQGRHLEAAREAARLLSLRGDARVLRLRARELGLAGRPSASLWRRLTERARWDDESRLELANLLVEQGKRPEAIRLVRSGFEANPTAVSLRRALRALGVAGPLDRFRVDGSAAIAAYRKARWGDGKAPVYVLDRSVVRVFPSGARLTLTHQIVHLRTREAIERYAEVKLPPGVQVLTLRTVKPDGSFRVPAYVGEKNSVSLTDVQVGDLIEVEYLSASRSQAFWGRGGFFGSRFTFRSLAAHFFRSELLVVRPPGMPLQVTTWGATPRPVTKKVQGLLVTRWTAHRAPRVAPEPLIPNLAGILPTLLVGSGVRWSEYLRRRAELAYDREVASFAVRSLAARLCAGKPVLARARAAYRWVQRHVAESGDYSVSASQTLAARSGSRLALLRALLGLCKVGSHETRLIRPRNRALGKGPIPPVRLHTQPSLWVKLPTGEVYLIPQLQQAPFGYLPPMLRLASAVSVDRPGAALSLTPDQPDADSRRTSLSITLEQDGSAVISGREKLSGMVALKLRAAIRRVPAKRLRQYLERAFFGRYFLGAVITRLSFRRVKRLEKPLEMIYRLEVPRLARPVKLPGGGRRLVLRSGFFPALVGRIYARLARRRLPLRLGPMGPLSLDLTLRLPSGYRLEDLPRSLSLSTPFGSFHMHVSSRGDTLSLRRTLRIPYRVVSPGRYPAFSLFAARVDRAERVTVVMDKK